jgi:amino acid transporter
VGVLVALIALVVPIESLADFVSLGSLYAFTTVDLGLLMYRYGDGEGGRQSVRAFVLMMVFWVLCIVGTLMVNLQSSFDPTGAMSIVAYVCLAFLIGIGCVFAFLLPQRSDLSTLVFRTPFVPLVPMVGIFVNTMMMTARSALTYYSFLVWFAIGLCIYFFYGVKNSVLRVGTLTDDEKNMLLNSDSVTSSTGEEIQKEIDAIE